MFIFHIATEADWLAATTTGTYTTSTVGRTLEQEGFIHLSRDSQAAAVLGRYYADVDEPLIVLVVDTTLLTSPWQFDDVPSDDVPSDDGPGSAPSFPHIYGALNCTAVVATRPVSQDAAGRWQLPTLPTSI